jgi:glycolate oxidase
MKQYGIVSPSIIEELAEIVGSEYLIGASSIPGKYGYDAGTQSGRHYLPEVVVYPADTRNVAAVIKVANRERIPVTPRGGGTGLAGGAVAVYGGILLDLGRMNRIVHINKSEKYLIAQSSVPTIEIQQTAYQQGLLYAGDPCSSDECVIGGNIATNAGGNLAVKYGVTADQIYELEIVTAQGEIATLGGHLKKNSTGYGLVKIFAGSEGTLGIITRATLKLQPLAPIIVNYVAVFADLAAALAAVTAILDKKVPDIISLELMDRGTVFALERYRKELLLQGHKGDALIIQIEAQDQAELQIKYKLLTQILGTVEHIAFFETDGTRIWQARRMWGKANQAEKPVSVSEDIVVPVHSVLPFIESFQTFIASAGFEFRIAGHAGDGNLHLRIMPNRVALTEWEDALVEFRKKLYQEVYRLGGRLSGEHGIGLKRKAHLAGLIDPVELTLMKAMKQAFDPNNILNPGKIFDLD